MEEIKDGGQAYPMHERDDALRGMTLRDYFAGQALNGLSALEDNRICPSTEEYSSWRNKILKADAEYCYLIADAMLKARETEGNMGAKT